MPEFQLFHVTNKIAIIHKNKILLLTDRFDKKNNAVMLPGGRMDEGENVFDALAREIFEELNFDLKSESNLTPVLYKTIFLTGKGYYPKKFGNTSLVYNAFVLNVPDDVDLNFKMEDDVTEPMWVGNEDVKHRFDNPKIAALFEEIQSKFIH